MLLTWIMSGQPSGLTIEISILRKRPILLEANLVHTKDPIQPY